MKQISVSDTVAKAAVELFAANGYANTSVQQIVDAAGVTKGAMYHYYQSKDDLLFGIYDRILSLQQQHLDELISAGGETIDLLRRVCVDVIETSIAHLPEGTVFYRSAHMLSEIRQHEVTRRRRAYHDRFAELILRGQSEGVLRTDIAVPVLIAHFFSDLHYLTQWFSPTGRETAARVAEDLTNLFLTAVRTSQE